MTRPQRNRFLLVGWDAADWKIIAPLVDEGKMPNLQSLIENGVMGNLATINPVLSPMLWSSIATGKRPFKHGIHGFAEPDPDTGSVRPITILSRKTKAVWNILNQHGLRSNVIGWWPSHPAEPLNGVMVSNHFQQAGPPLGSPWPMRPGTVHPPELAEKLAPCRVHPWELDGEILQMFIPRAAEIDQEKDKRLLTCAKLIAECAGIHAAATELMHTTEWDFTAVYYDAIDHFGHAFMRYHPPKQDSVSQEDFEMYKDVVEAGYRYHDLMLGTLLYLAGEDTTVMLISDHGFHPDEMRPLNLPNEPAGPAAEHRPFGIFVASGPGIKTDDLVFGASLLDIAPTILTRFGLAVGRDMDGRALTGIFEASPAVDYVDSWDEIEGDHDPGLHPPDTRLDPVEAKEAIDQLVALGYIDEPDPDNETAVKETVRELQYNLARSYTDANRHHEAAEILEKLWTDWPEESRFGVHQFQALLALERVAEAREIFKRIKVNKLKYGAEAAEEFRKLCKELLAQQKEARDGDAAEKAPAEDSKALTEDAQDQAAKPRGDEPPADPKSAVPDESVPLDFEKLEPRTQQKLRRLRARSATNPFAFNYLEGLLLQAEHQPAAARACFENALESETHQLPNLHQKIGECSFALREYDEAERHFREVLEIDPVNPHARLGLARTCFRRGRHLEAAEEALAAAGQAYHNPRAHYLAGAALARCDRVEEAVYSMRTALEQNPVFPQAHRHLAQIYQSRLGDWSKAAEHRRLARDSTRRIRAWNAGERPADLHELSPAFVPPPDPAVELRISHSAHSNVPPLEESITIVSGLPRSGTSMLMQMLEAGGLPALTDRERAPDESNPRGYFEFEKAKALGNPGSDRSWLLAEAKGKAVKIVAQLLPHLPRAFAEAMEKLKQSDPGDEPAKPSPLPAMRIIVMERPLDEIIPSQEKMLERRGTRDRAAGLTPEKLAATFRSQLEGIHRLLNRWTENNPDRVALLQVRYHDALADPAAVAKRLNTFLGGSLDESAMASAIDPSLRRERGE